ncbi:hypothetical protein [Lysobacter sp. F6437]|uniref:hypothetical protein n=1 Tax=Lysobacter sp. F6437 TaxID=3459296 RepID=UPI00403DB88C
MLALTTLLLLATNAWAFGRHGPALGSAHAPVRMSLLGECSVIYFFYVGEGDGRHIEAYALNPDGKNKMLFVGSILPEGGPPHIESVLLRNVDADSDMEILILSRWEIRHSGMGTTGDYYRTYVFDQNLKHSLKEPRELKRLPEVEKTIGEGFDGVSEGQSVNFPVKSADAIDQVLEARSGQ